MSSPDPGEYRTALEWLEMIINETSGVTAFTGFYDTVDVPLTADENEYLLSDFTDDGSASRIFSVVLVRGTADPVPIPMIWESESLEENVNDTGSSRRVVITDDPVPTLKVYPTPTDTEEDAGDLLRLRIQTYSDGINHAGTGNENTSLRPSWYLFMTKRLAYEIGLGPVRRLDDRELKRLKDDADMTEAKLLGRDGQRGPTPPVTEPMAGTFDMEC